MNLTVTIFNLNVSLQKIERLPILFSTHKNNLTKNMNDFSFMNVPLPLIFLLILLIIVHATKRARKLPPSPRRLPIIGHILHVGYLPHRSLQQLSQKFGDLMHLQLGCVPAYVISSPELAEEVLRTHDIDFCSRPQTVAYKKLSYNSLDVAFSIYGDNWRRMRKICNMELFSNSRVQSSRAIREEEVAKTIKEISEFFTAHELITNVDLTDKITNLAQVISCRLALGRNWHRRDPLSRNKLLAPLRVAKTMKAGIFVADYFPWAGWIDVVRGWTQKLEQSIIEASTVILKTLLASIFNFIRMELQMMRKIFLMFF